MRSDASIEDIARSFQQNFKLLQNKGVIPPFKIDESDIISLALQGLFPFRVGCVQGDIDSDNETIHVPQSSPAGQNQSFCDFPTGSFALRTGQKPQPFQDFVRKSPESNGRSIPSTTLPNGSFSTAYSSFSEESFDFPQTPMTHSPHYYFDGPGSHAPHHLTPYSSHDPANHSNGHGHSFPTNLPVLVSQPLLDKPHVQRNVQTLPTWGQHMSMNTPSMHWQQGAHGPVTSPGVPVQLVSHHEPVYNNWHT